MKESGMKHGKRDFHSQWIFMIPNYGLVSCTSKNVIEAHEEDEKNTKTPFRIHCQLFVLCFLNRHVSKLLNLVLHISKKRVSRRGKHSRKSRLLMATELCQNVKVCLQSTPNFVLFRLLEGLDHVLGYYIATHCWWATVSYAELRNKGHVWLAESNSKILVFYWPIQKAIRSAWNQEIGRVLFHWNLARCLYRDGETQRKSNMVVTIIWA